MESLDMKRAVICIFLMALVTYVPRVLPLTVFRKQIRSRYIRSFLDYTLKVGCRIRPLPS